MVNRPCGFFNESYAQEFIIVRTPTQWVFLLCALAFVFTMPLYTSGSILNIANYTGIVIISCIGLQILMGYCGQMSIGQSAFMAVGAYTSAIMIRELGVSFWVALPCAALVTGIIGIIVGLPSLRVKGFYLMMSTLAAQVIIPWVFGHAWQNVTGGIMGIDVPSIKFFDIALTSPASMFFLIWIIVALGTFFSMNLRRSHTGRALIAIRDNDLAAELMGINLMRYKLLAFFICSLYAGVAGALWAEWTRFLTPEQFNLHNSVLFMGMLIVGGLGSNAGVFMGCIFLIVLDEAAKFVAPGLGNLLGMPAGTVAPAIAPFVFGIVILLFLVFQPRGMAHRWEQFKLSYRLNPFSY
jgi:branched-chain amino acid transport system permease protein